jgi:hypothetical protein
LKLRNLLKQLVEAIENFFARASKVNRKLAIFAGISQNSSSSAISGRPFPEGISFTEISLVSENEAGSLSQCLIAADSVITQR